jgi:acyl carrier protein
MMGKSVEQQLAGILAEVFEVSQDTITQDIKIGDIEAWDSLGHLRLFMSIEEKMGVKFSTDEIVQISSLEEIKNSISTKQK